MLLPGNYRLQGQLNNYITHETPLNSPIILFPEQTETYDFCLEPMPKAIIKGVVTLTGSNAPPQSSVRLWENGSFFKEETNWNPGGFIFEILFAPGSPQLRCFTLTTGSADGLETLAAETKYSFWKYPDACAKSCSGNSFWSLSHTNNSYMGWSSAKVRDEVYAPGVGYQNVSCSLPWKGSDGMIGTEKIDRLCVSAGDEKIVNAVLDPIPTTTVSGVVRDSDNNLLKNASIYFIWPSHISQVRLAKATTDANGFYLATVPAVQDLFPNDYSHTATLSAQYNFSSNTGCCSAPSFDLKRTDVATPDLRSGTPQTVNFVIQKPPAPENQICGNLTGVVKDYQTSANIQGATIDVASTAAQSQNDGGYHFVCGTSALGYKIPIGNVAYEISKSGYYTRTTKKSDSFYVQNPLSLSITQNPPNPPVFNPTLLKTGTGTVKVYVRDENENSLSGINVAFYSYSGTTPWIVPTNSGGESVFPSAVESWPPPSITDQDEFNLQPLKHKIVANGNAVSPNPAYGTAQETDIELLNGQVKTIYMTLTATPGTGGT